MRRIGIGAVLVAAIAALGACTTIDRAVRGFETGPGGWSKISEARTAMSSDVQYLGASAEGHIIVRLGDGTTQIWKAGR
jgi:hypothetical protein